MDRSKNKRTEMLIDVTKAMKQAENLMHDYAWNGEQKAYEQTRRRYEYYKDLHYRGVLYDPQF